MSARTGRQVMKIYVVLEEDRGCGVSVVGVYRNREDAERVAETSSRLWVVEEELQ
jgi:hypothetical protein